VLEPLDTITVPRGENRSFRNVSNGLGRLIEAKKRSKTALLVKRTPDAELEQFAVYANGLGRLIEAKKRSKTALLVKRTAAVAAQQTDAGA
jgi:hypothetical protein